MSTEPVSTTPKDDVPQVDKWISDVSEALGLFPSVIKSGEAWSPTCEDVRQRARASLSRLGEAVSAAISTTPPATVEAQREAIPADIAAVVLRVGRAEWGQTESHDAEGHGRHVADSVRKTAAHFGQSGEQRMQGLYVEGTDKVICHTGTSPNSPDVARALTGAWNWLHDQVRDTPAPVEPQREAELRGERRAIARIVMVAEAISFQAGVGGRETAGAILSYLATSPDEIAPFVAGDLSPLDFKGDWMRGGCLTWHAVDGKVVSPDDLSPAPVDGEGK